MLVVEVWLVRLTYAVGVEMREELASGAAGGLDQETGKHAVMVTIVKLSVTIGI